MQGWLGSAFAFADAALLFDVVLHVGTLGPVLYIYRSDLRSILRSLAPSDGAAWTPWRAEWWAASDGRQLALWVVIATLPTVVVGLLLKDVLERAFHRPRAVCWALLATAGLLVSTALRRRARPQRALSLGVALLIGVGQALAVTPGISRSGTTIAVALLLGVGRAEAARFSFLLSIPAILGALILSLKGPVQLPEGGAWGLFFGFAAALFVGYGALVLLLRFVRAGRLHVFAYYLVPVAVLGLLSFR